VLWERSVTEQRYNAVLEVLEAGLPVTEVADRYGVSRQSVHTWIARYRAGGLEGLADRSHRPNRCPHQLAAAVEAKVCELRRQHPGWGPQRLRHELERRGVMPLLPSRSAIWRLLVRNRLISPGGRRRKRAYRRWERERPMELWQLDLVEIPLADGTEIKVLTGVDDHSRYCVSAQVMVRATGRAVCQGLVTALRRYGVPEEILTDNGKQFTGRFGKPRPAEVLFERILRENGITHRLTGVRAPTTTGKVERFHQTLRTELLATLPPLPSAEVAQQVLDAWVEDYNQRRPHQALGGQTPAERFHAKPDLDHPNQDAGAALPLWLPAALGPQRVGLPTAEPVRVQRPPATAAKLAGTNPTVLPLELDARVPACGNLGVAGRQVWLGRRLAGRTVQVRLDGATMHVSLDGRLLKTLPCRLQPKDLGQGRLAGARPAGPAPASVAAHAVLVGAGDAVEVDRRVNAAGTVGVAGQQISVGLLLAGQTVTLRLEAATMHVLADGALVRSLPSPVQAAARARLHGARLARGALVVPQGPVVVRRRASQRGQLQVAGERVQVGLAHARQVLTIHVAEREFRIFDEGGLIKVIARRDRQEVTRFKAHNQHKPHGNNG
jgi:transposase InsO family protein